MALTPIKISEMATPTALTGAETLPAVQAGANVEVTARQLRQLSEFGRPPLIAFAGDSIAAEAGALTVSSPWYWAQVRQPRLYTYNHLTWDGTNGGYNLARSGSHSGPHTGFAGSNVFGPGTPDMNMPLTISTMRAVAPDILYVEVGTNDNGAALTETFANVKAFVDAVNAPHTIVCSILPRTLDLAAYRYTNAKYRRWAEANPRIHFLDYVPALLDDTSANNGPIGGNGSAAGALTIDGLHPGPIGARAMASMLDKLLDDLNVPKCDYIATGQNDAYHATNQPLGNLADQRGAMGGTTGTHSTANSTGPVATGWRVSAPDSDLTVVASKTTMTVDGKTVTAQKLDFTAAGTLPAQRTVGLEMQFGGWAQPAGADPIEISALIQLLNLVNCQGVEVYHYASGGVTARMGQAVPGTYTTAIGGALLPSVSEILKVRFPGTIGTGTSGAAQIGFAISFAAGTPAGALGSVCIAQVGAWPQIPTV